MNKIWALLYIIKFYCAFIFVKFLTVWFLLFKPAVRKKQVVYLELFGPPMAGYTARSKYWSDLLVRSGYHTKVLWLTTYEYYKKCIKSPGGLMHFQSQTLWKRIFQCFSARHAEILIIRREILMYNDYGKLFMEKWLRTFPSKLIIDFDDDIAAAKNEAARAKSLFSVLMQEEHKKFTRSLAYFDGFIYGTQYLKNRFLPYASHKNFHTLILPTCVPYFEAPLKDYTDNQFIRIGWVGSSYNLKNLESIFPQLEEVHRKQAFQFILICDENTHVQTSFPLQFIKWNQENEYRNIAKIDIGLMPLPRNEVSAGKSAYKLLQYMCTGVVPVASAVTVNKEVVQNGLNGFLVYNEEEWSKTLIEVLACRDRFGEIGRAAFHTAMRYYSYKVNEPHYLDFIHEIIGD